MLTASCSRPVDPAAPVTLPWLAAIHISGDDRLASPDFVATLAIVPVTVKAERLPGCSKDIQAPKELHHPFCGAKTRFGLHGPRGVGAEITARNRPSCEYALHSISSPGSLYALDS